MNMNNYLHLEYRNDCRDAATDGARMQEGEVTETTLAERIAASAPFGTSQGLGVGLAGVALAVCAGLLSWMGTNATGANFSQEVAHARSLLG